jgi:hypothetical protein
MIENGGGQPVMLNQNECLLQRHGCGNDGACRFESIHHFHSNEGLILNNEDRAASKVAGHLDTYGAAKRKLPAKLGRTRCCVSNRKASTLQG